MKGIFKKPSLYILAAVISAFLALANQPIMDEENYQIVMMSKQRIALQKATAVDFSNSRLYDQEMRELLTAMGLLGFACSFGLHLVMMGLSCINREVRPLVDRLEKKRCDY